MKEKNDNEGFGKSFRGQKIKNSEILPQQNNFYYYSLLSDVKEFFLEIGEIFIQIL